MEGLLLKDQNVYPDKEVLEKALGNSYQAYEELLKAVTAAEYGLVPEWRYYNDGKAWLCKVCHKKKTVFWLSVRDKSFRTAFYFTEKTGSGIALLDIDADIKKDFAGSKLTGKLIPLVIEIRSRKQ